MFNVAVCDADKHCHAQIEDFFRRFEQEVKFYFQIKYFFSGEELIEYLKSNAGNPFHILIIDVVLRKMNGIETAKWIRNHQDYDLQIIFLTHDQQSMLDCFDVQPFQFITKPTSYDLFSIKLLKLCEYIVSLSGRYLTIRTDGEYVLLKIAEVLSIKKVKDAVLKNQLEISTADCQYQSKGVLNKFRFETESPLLMIHRSIIVNIEHIHKISSNTVSMSNGDQFPIGRSYMKEVKDVYNCYMTSQYKKRMFF